MPDVFSKEKRSEVMSKIRSKGSRIELKMKAALEENHITFEYQPKMFGKPDFFIPPKITIFCDSSFWHGRYWKKLQKQLHKEYWHEHIKKNRERDRIVNATLRRKGYVVLRFWDDQIEKQMRKCISIIKRNIQEMAEEEHG